jgi:hypothetical protein
MNQNKLEGLLLVWAPKISGASSQSYPFVLNKFLLLRRETDKAVIVTKVFIDNTAARTFRKLTSPKPAQTRLVVIFSVSHVRQGLNQAML